ncbi:MAG TPA: hypothetical protein VF134_04055 [Candidatus Dormibacteraeota bacterium]
MAVDQVARFSFSLAELAAVEEPKLRLLEAESVSLPSGGQVVVPCPRPRWMPRLLPVFAAGEPLSLQVRPSGSPAFAARLLASLAAIFAASGREAGVRVARWESSLAVSAHDLDRLPSQPHAVLAVAELEPASVRVAGEALRAIPAERAWLVVDGDIGGLDRLLGLDSLAGRLEAGRAFRLPLLGSGEVAGLRRGIQPGMARARTGRRYLELAAALVNAYLEARP